jgi:predicted AlkP superfamily phosphohydrolase/phosphomutase
MKRVIVIGLDGLEPKIVEPMLARGQLPNLARLRAQGGFSRVATTYPAQTPVAWSTFATGTNPGGHGLFDFLRRDAKSYLPDISLNRYEQKNAFLPPKVVNLRRGTPVWDLLTQAGIESTVLRCPCTYPPDAIRGRMLSGMGVPDLRGGHGTATYYTTDSNAAVGESENLLTIRPDANGVVATHLIGPRNAKARDDARLDVTVHVDRASRSITVRSEGGSEPLVVREGEWSDWLRVKFKLGMLQSVRGMVRFHLVSVEPELAFYASPINFDPQSPLFPISAPADYAGELMERVGDFATTGMVEDHGGLSNERFGEEAFLAQCNDAWNEREAMLLHELQFFNEGLLYCLFDTPDRVQHMFWRFREPEHPANRGEAPDPALAGVIEDQYRRGDAIVGKALEYADHETLVIALSDHGFNSFQRGVHLNTWLYDQGLLALRDGARPGKETSDLLLGVDWSRTKAYALGLGGIYLNLKGREGQGIVAPDEAEGLKAAIAEKLTGLTDPERGSVAIRGVRSREEVYSGPYTGESPDLLVRFNAGYRASWSTAMGGIGEGQFEDNTKKWSGDHIIDPELVPGVLFMNRPFRGERASLVDLAPTILHAFGLPKGAAMEGSTLLAS